jgi:hypothetical protein
MLISTTPQATSLRPARFIERRMHLSLGLAQQLQGPSLPGVNCPKRARQLLQRDRSLGKVHGCVTASENLSSRRTDRNIKTQINEIGRRRVRSHACICALQADLHSTMAQPAGHRTAAAGDCQWRTNLARVPRAECPSFTAPAVQPL